MLFTYGTPHVKKSSTYVLLLLYKKTHAQNAHYTQRLRVFLCTVKYVKKCYFLNVRTQRMQVYLIFVIQVKIISVKPRRVILNWVERNGKNESTIPTPFHKIPRTR